MTSTKAELSYHAVNEAFHSGWIPTRTVSEWKKKMEKTAIADAQKKVGEGYKVSYEFEEVDGDTFNEEYSKMVLRLKMEKDYHPV